MSTDLYVKISLIFQLELEIGYWVTIQFYLAS